jgi:hypothetical protein
MPVKGGQGISTRGDVLINMTADGVDLNDIWNEIQDVLAIFNEERSAIRNLCSFRTLNAADAIPQSISSESFEEATEFGVPRAVRPPADYLKLGYQFRDWDLSLRSTWKFLREATAEQVQAGVTRILEAENKNTNGTVLNRLFNPATELNEWQHTCYGLWNADGMIPPMYLGTTFDGTHTHYLTSGSTSFDSPDLEQMMHHIREHGYGIEPNTAQLVTFFNPDDFTSSLITTWRAGHEYSPSGPLPQWDFIPSALQPSFISNEIIQGPIPPADYNGLKVWGSYGYTLLVQSAYVPKGYVATVATSGPNDIANPIGFREHVNPAYQGLRHIAGVGPYPLVDSFFARGFGVGTRHRGAGCVMRITTSTSYTAPTIDVHA